MIFYQGQKRKSRSGNDVTDMIVMLEKKAEEREEKMFKMYCEVEDRRRILEREHELKMEELMMTMIERILTNPPVNHQPYPPYNYQ